MDSLRPVRWRRGLLVTGLAMLVLPALLLTLVRWTQPGAGPAVRLVSFTPLAVPAYAVALTGLLVSVARRRSGRPWAWTGVGVIGALLGLHLWWYSPQVVGTPPAAATGAHPVRVLTLNTMRGTAAADEIVATGRGAAADLIVLEEITAPELSRLGRAGLTDDWTFRAGRPGEGTQGTMVFSRFPLRDPQLLATHFDSWAVTVAVPDGRLRLLAVHPYPPVIVDRWHHDHATIRAAAANADVVAGDLNATPDHRPLARLAEDGFRSAAELTNLAWAPTWPANGRFRVEGLGLPPLVQIDHVLVGPSYTATSCRAVTVAGTDHRAVIATIARR